VTDAFLGAERNSAILVDKRVSCPATREPLCCKIILFKFRIWVYVLNTKTC